MKRIYNGQSNTKKDRSTVNNQGVVSAKFVGLKEEVRKSKGGEVTPGSNHVVEGEIFPN